MIENHQQFATDRFLDVVFNIRAWGAGGRCPDRQIHLFAREDLLSNSVIKELEIVGVQAPYRLSVDQHPDRNLHFGYHDPLREFFGSEDWKSRLEQKARQEHSKVDDVSRPHTSLKGVGHFGS